MCFAVVCINLAAVFLVVKEEASQPPPKRPRLLVSVNARIPTSLRQNFLDNFIDEYLKFLSEEEAYKKVLY